MAFTHYSQWFDDLKTNDDTRFRAWGSYISGRLDALGFPKTADTGQVDWATAVHPGSSNLLDTPVTYEVRRLNDTMQSTHPVFFKIGFGAYGIRYTPALNLSIGEGSDGSGTLTHTEPGYGPTTAVYSGNATTNMIGGGTIRVGGDGSSFYILNGNDNPTLGASVIALERSRKFDGTLSDGGGVMVVGGGHLVGALAFAWAGMQHGMVPFAQIAFSTGLFYNGPNWSPTIAATNNPSVVMAVPAWTVPNGDNMCGASKILIGLPSTQVSVGQVIPVPHYGETPEFLVTDSLIHGSGGYLATQQLKPAIRIGEGT